MDKKTILRRLLEEGVMARPEDLERLDESNIDEYIKQKGMLPQENLPETPSLQITAIEVCSQPKLSVSDLASFYMDRLQRLKKLFPKIDAVSINKTKGTFSNVSVIGMVRQKTSRGYLIEDETGDVELVTDQELADDDVVGVTGQAKEGMLFASNITYPGLAFNRHLGRIQKTKIFMGNNYPEDVKVDDYLVCEKKEAKARFSGFSEPCTFKIAKGNEEFTILYIPFASSLQEATTWLNKRYVPTEPKNVPGPVDMLAMNNIPDLIWMGFHEKSSIVHKGVIIAGTGDGFILDLETREIRYV